MKAKTKKCSCGATAGVRYRVQDGIIKQDAALKREGTLCWDCAHKQLKGEQPTPTLLRVVGNIIVDSEGATVAIANLPKAELCQRMVDCTNALEGFNPAGVAGVVEALKELVVAYRAISDQWAAEISEDDEPDFPQDNIEGNALDALSKINC